MGAISVNAMKSWASREFPDYWLLLLGGTFVLVVLFMPKGLVGIPAQIQDIIARLRRKKESPEAAPPSGKTTIATDP
ncbi:MAG: hypothetical protein EOP85_12155 [Verrucomicrobiaceae bacterium]|nr:MAG: hypothetical protein EOP85_12155 [Verrucomicrobiaceae bacterium]